MSEDADWSPSATLPEDFEDLYENAPCGYLSMQPDGRIIRVNATLANWTGYIAGQLVQMRFQDLLTIGTRILYETSFAPLLILEGFYDEISLDLSAANGGQLAVLASGKIRNDANGRPQLVRVTLLKASERRRYERQLVTARKESEKHLQMERETAELREQFIAVLGHDLRNPLASIAGGARLLQKAQSPDQQNRLLNVILESSFRMAGLIDNVLDFARGRLGAGIPLELRPNTLLAPVLDQVVAELCIAVPDRIIETDFNVPNPIKCDPSRIGQLVSNLLGNAITHGAPEEPVRIHAEEIGDALTIWVANGGDPIPAAAMDRLFQPFFRGEVRASQQGLGLGLHIASEIAKAHGGSLKATSTPRETRFTFVMPIAIDGGMFENQR